MAEALDTYSDLELSGSDTECDLSDLHKEFNAAAEHVKNIVGNLDKTKLLEIYSYYKQATEGDCNIPRPKWLELQGKQKWDVWNALSGLPMDSAKERYIRIISEIDPGWDDKSRAKENATRAFRRAAVSSLQADDEPHIASHSVFDFCKDGDTSKVDSLLKFNPEYLQSLDPQGLGLIHWAADRGFPDMLKMLLKHSCSVSMKDNIDQTALHYAATCGHEECILMLLEHGADKNSRDHEGLTPLDVADESVKQLLL